MTTKDEKPSRDDLDRILSLPCRNRGALTVEEELDEAIRKLGFLEGAIFDLASGRDTLIHLEAEAFDGLSTVLREVRTSALFVREALTGSMGPDYKRTT